MNNTLKFHHLKIQDQKDNWLTLRIQNNIGRKVMELKPKNVYISLNEFLNYREYDKTYKYQNVPLRRYALIDIDAQNFNNFYEAKRYFLKILRFLIKSKAEIMEINMTNAYGGFQIVVSENAYSLMNNKIFSKIDKKVLNDDKRVRRYCPSWNSNKSCFSVQLYRNSILPERCLKITPNPLPSLESQSTGHLGVKIINAD